jgi:hypothetical protein
VRRFPEYEDQTADQVHAGYSTWCDHPLLVAIYPSDTLVVYDPSVHAGSIVKTNHKSYPPQKPLSPDEAIGVVLYPYQGFWWWKYAVAAFCALLVGVGLGRSLRR